MTEGRPPAFEARALEKHFGARTALAPLDLRIEQGESVALVGPSGSGKTTLLNLMAGLLAPDGGELRLLGRPVQDWDRRGRSARVGMMHQQFDLVPNLSVLHNVLAGNLGRWSLGRALRSLVAPVGGGEVEEVLAEVGLEGRARERTSRLSGGEQQRVALARLLVQNPHALLADEPVSSLDPARAEALVELLVRLASAGGHTLVASLHTVELARHHFARIVALRDGAVMFDRAAAEVTSGELEMLYRLEAADVASGTAALTEGV
ncbi:MAG: ATP-binding cassette domain-containing protein [Dehalococcoidia bacterium]